MSRTFNPRHLQDERHAFLIMRSSERTREIQRQSRGLDRRRRRIARRCLLRWPFSGLGRVGIR
jgi:hypothetical protein